MKFLMVLGFLAGCSSAPSSMPTKEGAIGEMMVNFYGNYDSDTKKGLLEPDSKFIQKYQKMRGGGLYVLPGDEIICEMKKWLEISKDSGVAISACNNSIGGDCPTCAPVLGAALIEKGKDERWRVVHGSDFLEAIGGHGVLPEPTLVKLGVEASALQFDIIQEEKDSIAVVRRLYSTDPGFKKILEISISGSNAANCGSKVQIPCYNYSSAMKTEENAVGPGPLRFFFQGTEPITSNPKLIKDANLVKKYCYTDGYYVRPCGQ